MEFQIPQFITREATVTTGMTFRQFSTLGIGGFSIFMLFFLLKENLLLFIVIAMVIAGITLLFAFGQVGGQSFPSVFLNFVFYFFKPRVYVWRHKKMPEKLMREGIEKIQIVESAGEERKIGVTKQGHLENLWRETEIRS
jgi:hypothetical protein